MCGECYKTKFKELYENLKKETTESDTDSGYKFTLENNLNQLEKLTETIYKSSKTHFSYNFSEYFLKLDKVKVNIDINNFDSKLQSNLLDTIISK